MRKISVVIMFIVVLLTACKKEASVIPPLPPDSTSPTLDFEFVSVASTLRFIPFGDTLYNRVINKGYEIQLSDTNEYVLTACPGIVSSIVPDTTTAGGNLITVKFTSHSMYSFTYGGVTRVEVSVNDSLRGGSILGKVTGSGIVDFQLIKNGNLALCPSGFSSPGVNTSIQQAILKSNYYHPTDTVTEPCVVSSISF